MCELKTLKGTILTVGLTHEPVIYSLRQIQPDYAAFICTPESTKTLDKVWEEFRMPPSRVWHREITDAPEQIGRLVHEFYAAFLWLRDECRVSPTDIHTDPTPGRKWMSAGTTMMASFLGLRMFYTDVRFIRGEPDPTTMRFIPLGNAYDQTGFIEAEKGRELFNRYEFATASEVFRRIRPTLSAQADLYTGLERLARILHEWELFEHYEQSLRADFADAFECLERCVYSGILPQGFTNFIAEARRLADAIEEVTVAQKPTLLATIDLVLNAERRIRQGRYDDAAARSYRALESLSQLYLANCFQIVTGQPDYSRLTEKQLDEVKVYLTPLPDKIALENGWQMLFALGHPAAFQVLAQRRDGQLQNKFMGVLDDRNNSILAHGWQHVGEQRARNMVERLKALLADVEGESVKEAFVRLQPPTLPAFWSAHSR